MSNVHEHPNAEYLRQQIEGVLNKSGGGGTFDGMEARVAKLEAHVEHIQLDVADLRSDVKTVKSDISDIKTTLAAINAKLDSKVDYKWMLVAIFGICALILREEIRTLFTGGT